MSKTNEHSFLSAQPPFPSPIHQFFPSLLHSSKPPQPSNLIIMSNSEVSGMGPLGVSTSADNWRNIFRFENIYSKFDICRKLLGFSTTRVVPYLLPMCWLFCCKARSASSAVPNLTNPSPVGRPSSPGSFPNTTSSTVNPGFIG